MVHLREKTFIVWQYVCIVNYLRGINIIKNIYSSPGKGYLFETSIWPLGNHRKFDMKIG